MNAYRSYFHDLNSDEVLIGLNLFDGIPVIEIFEYFDSSIDITAYEYDENNDHLIFRSINTIDTIFYPVYHNDFQQKSKEFPHDSKNI